MDYIDINNKNFIIENITKIFRISRYVYVVRHKKDGNIVSTSISSKWLDESNIFSLTIRGDDVLVSLLSDKTKMYLCKNGNNYKTVKSLIINNNDIILYKELHTFDNILDNFVAIPNDPYKLISDLKFDNLLFIAGTQFHKDFGARIKSKRNGRIVHVLLKSGYVAYIPDKPTRLIINYTKEMDKRFFSHKIFRVK